jgi:hypothetical protein
MAKHHYYRVFRQDGELSRHMPDTAICTRRTLAHFLAKYGMVYVKPNVGGRGEGVTRAWRAADGRILYVVEKGSPAVCRSADELWDRLGLAEGRRHVVQQGLDLAEYHGRKYDLRVMMVRDVRRRWQYCGMLAKTAGPGSIVTNIARGKGEVVPALEALAGSHGARAPRIAAEILRLARRCNRMFDRIRYEWQMGYDFAVDRDGKVWLIEANPGNPAHELFAKLPDKTWYRRIRRMVKAYRAAHGDDSSRRAKAAAGGRPAVTGHGRPVKRMRGWPRRALRHEKKSSRGRKDLLQ